MKQWWQLDCDETVRVLESNASSGLSKFEAVERLKKYGPNELKEQKGRSALAIFFEQFEDFIIWVLIAAALVSGFLKEWIDAIAIITIVVINAILGFIQEFRAEKSLAALKKLSSPHSKVIRDGQHMVIASAELIPGDLVECEAGDNIPADCRLVYHSPNFTVQEASLTGESNPVSKTTLLLEGDCALADRANMVYMGTSVTAGKARAIVVETGMRTELGKIASMVQAIEHETTPLQKKLEAFGKWIVKACFILVAIVFALGIARGGKIIDMFLTAVSLAVAAIPEGLPAVVTIALALGVQRMVRRNALIRKLPAVETLGCATVICSDKTGTLTKNEMTVQAVFASNTLFKVTGVGYDPKGQFLTNNYVVDPNEYTELMSTLRCSALCNGAQLHEHEKRSVITGDPTEGALLVCAAKAGLLKEDLERDYTFVEELPFDSLRKKMTIVRKYKDRYIAFVKGAPDVMVADCVAIGENGHQRSITEADRQRILSVNDDLSRQAMRVLAFGYKVFDTPISQFDEKILETNLVFLGLIAMIDPPREEVKQAIKLCAEAGIKEAMITGDHKNTAAAIARELGFFTADSRAVSGEELERMSVEELHREVKNIAVYARVSPEHKLRIVRAWRHSGEVVAMTGDGVNDAPALKEADIGVAMGITGTDVTKEVSDMVITDDNFTSIVAAIEEGRGIYDNIKKFIHYLLSCNIGEILVMFVSSLVGLPLPLVPVQILWVNLVTDGLPALALGVDPVEPQIMKRKPRSPKEAVVTKKRAWIMAYQGMFIALCSLGAFAYVLFIEKEGISRARTAAFIVLSCTQLFHAFNCRSMSQSVFKLGIFTNVKLIYATLISFVLQMVVVYVPILQRVFKTEPLGAMDWVFVMLVSSLPLWLMEAIKFFNRHKTCTEDC